MSIKRWKLGWKRCDCVKCEAALTIEQTEENCGWVRWEDHKEEVARLKAEVERLRKAGDALYESEIGYYGEQILVDPKHHSGELCRNWIAAKEGKQP